MPTKAKRSHKADYVPQGVDLCQTPPYALKILEPWINPKWNVWEPASGERYLANALARKVKTVVVSDLSMGVQYNFFNYRPAVFDQIDAIITNPPYTIKFRWLARCYELGKPFALLLPSDTMFAARAMRLLNKFGFELVVPDKRIKFKMPNRGWADSRPQFSTSWYTWGFNIGKPITFVELRPDTDHFGVQLPLFPEQPILEGAV